MKLCALVLMLLISRTLVATPYYVVVASFSDEVKARHFTASVKSIFPEASLRFDQRKALHHVFAVGATTFEDAEDARTQVRKVAGFSTAWIFDEGHGYAEAESGLENSHVKLELYTGSSVLIGSSDNSYLSIAQNKGEVGQTTRQGVAKAFIFSAKNQAGVDMKAQVALLDLHGNTLSLMNTEEITAFYGKNVPQVFKLHCEVPGYNAEMKFIDVTTPEKTRGLVQDKDGVWQVIFSLTKQIVDEVSLRYCDLFYPNASVMKPTARFSMEKLSTLLDANGTWTIVINTHCGPGEKRDILVPAPERYFDRSLAYHKSGSDKQLTRERGKVIQDYLVAAGVDASRIRVMGWGSLNPLARQGDESQLHDRVDIDVAMIK